MHNTILLLSIALNILLIIFTSFLSRSRHCSCSSFSVGACFNVLDKIHEERYLTFENIKRSRQALQHASEFASLTGQGRSGWLWMLAAVDLDKSHIEAMYNLIENYRQLSNGPSHLGYSQLAASNLTVQERDMMMDKNDQKNLMDHFSKMRSYIVNSTSKLELSAPNISASFATLVSTWHVADSSSPTTVASFNAQIYEATASIYRKLRLRYPLLDSTELNHKFFQYQMKHMTSSSSSGAFSSVHVWTGFQEIAALADLTLLLRRAVVDFLQGHGFSREEALRRASHPLVVWASVHTRESIHQPHVTDDALVGGVYYVRVPAWSGRLELYDPRGKSPLRDLDDPLSPPLPPFHRVRAVLPEEGKLVLFPGWLVHSVLQASNYSHGRTCGSADGRCSGLCGDGNEEDDGRSDYRISLSLNLKGEWQDTSALHLQLS